MTLPPSGWYPSPDMPGRLRYWDGQAWTEHVYDDEHGRQISPVGLPPPPSEFAGTSDVRRPRGDLSDTGVLMSATFRAIAKTWRPMVRLAIPLLVIPYTIAAIALFLALDDVVLTEDEIIGLEAGRVWFMVIAVVASAVMAWIFSLAAAHQLVGHFNRAEPALRQSLAATRHGMLRLLGWGIAFVAAAIVAVVLVALVAASVPALLLLIVPGAIALGVWAAVKLAFFGITAAVAPEGEHSVAASAAVSKGRFWRVLGRLALITAVAIAVSFATSLVLAPLQGDQGEFLRDPGPGEEVRLDEFFPSSATTSIIFGVVGGLTTAGQTLILVSATAHIYHEAAGPIRPELESPDDGLG